MTTGCEPSAGDIQALLEFLPKLYGEGAPLPVVRWFTETKDGALTLPCPQYNETVKSFIDLIVNQGCWMVGGYIPEEAKKLLMECARLTGASAAGESPAGRRRPATTSTPSHGPSSARMGVKR